jgi:hypothetical protein
LPFAQLTFGGCRLGHSKQCTTLSASPHGIDSTSGKPIEIRLAARALGDPTRFAFSGEVVFDPSSA